MKGGLLRLGVVLVAGLLVTVFVYRFVLHFPSAVTTDATGLRTYTWVSEWFGIARACKLTGGQPQFVPTVRIDPAAPEPVWLEVAAGHRASAIWPAETFLDLHAEDGPRLVFPNGKWRQDGELVELRVVTAHSASGTFDDPYFVIGRVMDGCYNFEPWRGERERLYGSHAQAVGVRLHIGWG